CPDTVVVFNHPWWDLTGIGQLRHDANVLAFLRWHGEWIHGLELNGYRPWAENRRVLPLARGFDLPVVAGGDRHGFVPNAILNLSHAACSQEFARELREDRTSHCVVPPESQRPFVSRILETASHVLRRDPQTAPQGWEDRVFRTINGVDQLVRESWNPPRWV